jgi:hypothetical protein
MRRFAYDLALRLGRVNVDEMLDEISWNQFEEWMVYDSLTPFTSDRDEYRFASIVSMLANINRDSKKQKDPWPIDQFVLRFGDMPEAASLKKKQTAEEQKRIGREYFLMFGGGGE